MTEAKGARGEGAWKAQIPEEAREHLRAAREEFRSSIEEMLPPRFLEHRRRARKEMLLATRSLIDHALKRLEETEKV